MATSKQPAFRGSPPCRMCGAEVQRTWRWCLACGYDPDDARPESPLFPRDPDGNTKDRATSKASAPSATARRSRRRRPAPPARVAATRREKRRERLTLVAIFLIGVLASAAVYSYQAGWVSSALGNRSGTASSKEWARFSPPDGSFSVELPGTPTSGAEQSGIDGKPLNMRIYGVDLGDLHYAVSYGDSSVVAATSDPATRLDDFVQSTARLTGGQVADSEDGVDLGLPANDYLIDVDGVTEMRGHALATGRRVYNITITGKQTRQEDLDRVIYSFAIL
jgi:hypothetical protein